MKPDKFIDAMGHLDESIIDEYNRFGKGQRTPAWVKYVSVAASVAVVLSATLLIWRHGGGTGPDVPPVTGVTDVVPGTDAPVDPPHVTHEDFAIVSVEAEKTTGNFISGDTDFVVKTENGTAEDVRTHLYISTAPEYSVIEIAEDTFEVQLAGSIADNTVVSLSYVEDGIIDQSWAFQTEGKLSLSGSYPRDGATTAPVNSVIELEFSYSSAEGVEDAVTFEPELTGTWEHAGRIWRFTPAEPLAKDTTYKIYVGKGITAEGKEIEKTATVTFSTYEERAPYSCDPGIITVDGINSYLPGGDVTIRLFSGLTDAPEIGWVSVEKFASYSDMLAFNDGETVYESEYLFDANYTLEKTNGESTNSYNMHLEETLPQGYYVARVYAADGVHLFDWIMQVHPLSVYAAVTERDVLIWVAENGELAEGVPVVFDDVEGVTGEDGTLLLKDSTNGYGEISYIIIGDKDAPFIVGAPNFTHDNYPRGYIYTDKPKYKSTDTVKAWGMIPLDLFYEEPDGEFTVMLGGEPDTEIVIAPDENGVFECELEVVNHKDAVPYIHLCYEGTTIAYRRVDIYDYYLKNYEMVASYGKQYFEQGENIEFEVKVTHVSGIGVAGKEIKASVSDGVFTAVTGTDGIAKFVITPEEYADIGSDHSYRQVPVTECRFTFEFAESADTLSTAYASATVYILRTPVEVITNRSDNTYTVEYKYISADKLNGVPGADGVPVTDLMGNTFICGAPYDTEVTVTLNLTKTEREFLGYKYDEFSKAKIPQYSEYQYYVRTTTTEMKMTEATENGMLTVDLSEFVLPESTDTERYMFEVHISYTLPNDYSSSRSYILSHNDFVEETSAGGTDYGPDNNHNPLLMQYDYFVFGYSLERSSDHSYNEGEVIPVELKAYDGSVIEGGKLMYFVYSQGIRQVVVTDGHEFEITVGELTFPKAEICAAYFKDGVFHRVADTSIGYNKEQRTLDVEITPDKEDYAPGDDVKLTVQVNTADGILPGASVNISVVNEAVFTEADNTSITSSLLTGAGIRDYFFSSYRDYSLANNVGGWGGGGGYEVNFGDTVYFGTAVTDEDGRCTVEFTLPEGRVTSYRVTVHAVNRELYSGVNTENIDAASDFFVQPGEVKYTKLTDDLVIPASLLTALPDTAVMNFRLNELDLELNVTAETGRMSYANFGKIPAGDYTVTVTAVSDSDPGLTHTITVPVSVHVSTLEVTESHTVDVTEELEFTPASSPVTMKFFNEETERYGRFINFIRETESERFDTVLAGTYASTIREKIYGIPGSNALSSFYYYMIYGDGYVNLSLLEDGDPDAILTALYMYITGDRTSVYGHYVSDTKYTLLPEVEMAESLLIRAAAGEAVLVDLRYAASEAPEDPYVRALLSLALSISGDTVSAKDLLIPMGDDATEGDRALYCAALVFVDRDAAGDEIDRLMTESPAEPYLGLAASLYMKTGEAQIGDTDSITVICGDDTYEVSVKGLSEETLILSVEDGETIRFEDATEGMRTSYSYQATFTPKEDENNVRGLDVSITEDMSVSDSGVIRIELGDISNDGKAKVALPSSLRYDSPYYGISSNIVTDYAYNDEQFIEIPVTAVSPGHYVLEPVIYTVDGVNYYSDTIEFTVGTGDTNTAVDPVTVTTEPAVTETEVAETAETAETETTEVTAAEPAMARAVPGTVGAEPIGSAETEE